jgi:hypothetical protein
MNKKEQIALRKVLNRCNCPNCPYKKGFEILMEYFDWLPDEDKPEINKRLKRLGI